MVSTDMGQGEDLPWLLEEKDGSDVKKYETKFPNVKDWNYSLSSSMRLKQDKEVDTQTGFSW